MEKGLAWSACLIAAAGTTAIAMIGFSTWRYDVALDRAAAALSARTGAATAAELSVTFWQERQAIDAYMAAPGTAALRAAWDQVPTTMRTTLKTALDRRHKPAALEADKAAVTESVT